MADDDNTYRQGPPAMVSAINVESPRAIADGSSVLLVDESNLSKMVVRCDVDSPTAAMLAAPFGSSSSHGSVRACGLRPGEIWLLGRGEEVESLADSLPSDPGRAVIDQTHGRSMIRVSGPEATGLLEKVCSLDWTDAMMPHGACASASVGKVSCDVVRDDESGAPSYLIACDRSFGQYLFEVLLDSGAEFGVSVG